jgi:hypothetical protein
LRESRARSANLRRASGDVKRWWATCPAQTLETRKGSPPVSGIFAQAGDRPGAAEPQPNRHRILQEATEATEEMTSPLITGISLARHSRNQTQAPDF